MKYCILAVIFAVVMLFFSFSTFSNTYRDMIAVPRLQRFGMNWGLEWEKTKILPLFPENRAEQD